ncbi:MAG: hypothetical protein OXC02_12210 [Rhodobacteraceae bacterium]|nr:hypothetical protein [Paracoccaceae bacterium]
MTSTLRELSQSIPWRHYDRIISNMARKKGYVTGVGARMKDGIHREVPFKHSSPLVFMSGVNSLFIDVFQLA